MVNKLSYETNFSQIGPELADPRSKIGPKFQFLANFDHFLAKKLENFYFSI